MTDRHDEPTAITPALAELIREVNKVFHPEDNDSEKPAESEEKASAAKYKMQTELTFSGLDMISAERRHDYASWMTAVDRICKIADTNNKDVLEYKACVNKYGPAQAQKVHDASVLCINHLMSSMGKRLSSADRPSTTHGLKAGGLE